MSNSSLTNDSMSYVIGITGGIGSGKTLVSDRFAELGVPVIDTDIIARQIVEPGQNTLQKLVTKFGDSILMANGHLNRSELRNIAFSSKKNKQALDQITHPAIRSETYQQIKAATALYCLVVVPLLQPTSPFIELMQRVLVVTAEQDIKIERVKKRSQLSKEEIISIMNTQLDDGERLSFANDVIHNNSSIEKAFEQVDHLHAQYLSLASSFNE